MYSYVFVYIPTYIGNVNNLDFRDVQSAFIFMFLGIYVCSRNFRCKIIASELIGDICANKTTRLLGGYLVIKL